LTEIDRVSETTKFNETYLLKGDKDTKTVTVDAHDAGIEGTLTQNTTQATFVMNALNLGDTIKIGGTEYTIGSDVDAVQKAIKDASAGELITVDGTQYTVVATDTTTPKINENADKNMLTIGSIQDLVAKGSTAVYKGKTYTAMTDATGADIDVAGNGDQAVVDDQRPQVITADKAYAMIAQELRLASSVGATAESAHNNTSSIDAADGTATTVVTNPATGAKDGALYAIGAAGSDYEDKIIFGIQKGTVERKEGLTFALHVGADADMTNKISVQIDALDTAGLGIQGLNVKDSTGASATYAIDAIADAVAHVSAQRSLLGAVQNRLEHTINNLDNVVE
ncbi:MAG: flagellar hook protein, partial [Lachnospiraceae bacterium]|nr:flagellar hook protein [Lachnospiraceae bacterium]